MARLLGELQARLGELDGVKAAYIQPPSSLDYPCIMIERSGSRNKFADNLIFMNKKVYTVTVIDRDPLSLIPDLVERFPYATFDRYFKTSGLHHFVFQLQH